MIKKMREREGGRELDEEKGGKKKTKKKEGGRMEENGKHK